MTGAAFEGIAQEVAADADRWPGCQVVRFGAGLDVTLPPLEYTVRPGDALRLETAPGECQEGMELMRVTINGAPLDVRPLWARYYETHPRWWLGEYYAEDGQVVRGRRLWDMGASA
jgi:hypothetical protein